MSNSVKKSRRQLLMSIIIIVLIAVFIGVITVILSTSKQTITVTNTEKDSNGSVVCKAANEVKHDVFKIDESALVSQEIRIMLSGNKMDMISYALNSKYESPQSAEYSIARLHAAYNEYLSKYRIATDVFSPNFVNVNDEARVSIFAKVKDINSYSGKLFFIEANEYNKIKTLSGEMLKKDFENKGFSCSFQD